MKSKRSQAWVETVVYTVIMLSIMGIVIAVAKPAIQERQDKILLEQSIETMNVLDTKVEELLVYGVGNTRQIDELGIKSGILIINSTSDSIDYIIEGKYAYSQLNQDVKVGRVTARTEKKASIYVIRLTIPYSSEGINITYNKNKENKVLSTSPTPYSLFIKNYNYTNSQYQIDFSLA